MADSSPEKDDEQQEDPFSSEIKTNKQDLLVEKESVSDTGSTRDEKTMPEEDDLTPTLDRPGPDGDAVRRGEFFKRWSEKRRIFSSQNRQKDSSSSDLEEVEVGSGQEMDVADKIPRNERLKEFIENYRSIRNKPKRGRQKEEPDR